MIDNNFTKLNEISRAILRQLVDFYVETGEPIGSETLSKKMRLKISSSSIRSIMAELQKEGLVYAVHKSSGRLPTDKGMRLFVEGLLEFGRLNENEKNSIESQCKSHGESYKEVLDKASETLSGLSNCAGLVVAPKYQNKIKQIDFLDLNNGQIMAVLVNENGLVENRIFLSYSKFNDSNLREASNYLNDKLKGKTIEFVKKEILNEIKNHKIELDKVSENLVKTGIAEISSTKENPYIFLHGQSTLLNDEIIKGDLDKLKDLFDQIANKKSFLELMDSTSKADGVKIFIGYKNILFNHSGLSAVMAPYKNDQQEVVGAIGVIGPMRINYSRIVPIVDFTSKLVGRILG
tara:strand:+ start:15648 stop:16694 length:1047 start_codon:yes stop_codon:yes gene_type:complete